MSFHQYIFSSFRNNNNNNNNNSNFESRSGLGTESPVGSKKGSREVGFYNDQSISPVGSKKSLIHEMIPPQAKQKAELLSQVSDDLENPRFALIQPSDKGDYFFDNCTKEKSLKLFTRPNLLTIISMAIDSQKLTLQLNPNEIQYIKNVLENDPELLHCIGSSINDIIVDGKLDIYDIPRVIRLISEFYKSHCIDRVIEDVGIINIVKFTVDSIIEFNFLPLPNIERELIKKIVDQSLDLLSLNIEFIKTTEKNLIYYLCCLFIPSWK